MKKILGIVAAVGAMAVLGSTDASAVCANPLSFGQTASCGGGYCFVVTPEGGLPAAGSFWSLSTGNPAVGTGNDNGGWPLSGWCRVYGPGCYLTGTWAQDGAIDGCIDGLLAPGKTIENMVVAFSSEAGGQGYYAAAASSRNNAGASEFEFAAIGQNIVLQPIPPPVVTGSVRNTADFSVAITVGSPNLTAFLSDGPATAGDVIKSYRIYKQVVPRLAPAPTSRDRATAWVAAGAAIPVGQPFSYTETACGTDSNIHLATSVVFDSGYESSVVSANARTVQCGPTIADPKDPKFRVIDRKTTKNPITPR